MACLLLEDMAIEEYGCAVRFAREATTGSRGSFFVVVIVMVLLFLGALEILGSVFPRGVDLDCYA